MEKFNYKKKYGQNFLINEDIKQKIYESISPDEGDLIIEIGPGKGALTRYLKKKKMKKGTASRDEMFIGKG